MVDGKYQGTWIPLDKGKELAASYGVTSYLQAIFDYATSPSAVAALPSTRPPSPSRTPSAYMMAATPGPPGSTPRGPPQYQTYMDAPANYQTSYFQHPTYKPEPAPTVASGHSDESGEVFAPLDVDAMGFPQGDMAIDQYGQPTYEPPAKRAKLEEPEEDESSDDEDDTPALPASMRFATKPIRPNPTVNTDKTRERLISLFTEAGVADIRAHFGLRPGSQPDFDVDMLIDELGHTALHWAAALAKMSLVDQLIDLGADIHRGNYAGETPLVRCLLTTNHAETGTFHSILENYLSPTIRTIDHAFRTPIHHIALVAGVPGRPASARTYMSTMLELVAKEQQAESMGMSLKMLVDVQDVHGDTALIIAARVGNRGLVQLLIEAGADKGKTNKLGLKAVDFGIETEVSLTDAVVG
jgi:regulatory protein SWI6